ncbi:MAG: hypothetical protein PHW14_05860 [Candidatus Omnitrophica bacterium]|nr:hypothetical protein [Candidatus Omnitrophota bacterium]
MTGTGMLRRANSLISAVKAVTAIAALGAVVSMSACMPSYPKEKLPEAVKEVCRIEYNMDVDVTVTDSTMGIYYPMQGLLDVNLGISEKAWDSISNLILVASRVVLSTDADIKFYCVITQDARLPELQVVIIKYVDDIKRGVYSDISRGESFKRTLFSINLTPQAKKERSIEKVFDKLGIADETRQKVMDEFFRNAPTKLSDIGYWRGKFYLKDITLPEFLAVQIANRMKIDFRSEKDLEEIYRFKSSEGLYVQDRKKGYFLIKFDIEDQRASDEELNVRMFKIRQIMKIASEVVYGYKFRDFDYMAMEDLLMNARVTAREQEVYDFNKKKLPLETSVQAPTGYFQT